MSEPLPTISVSGQSVVKSIRLTFADKVNLSSNAVILKPFPGVEVTGGKHPSQATIGLLPIAALDVPLADRGKVWDCVSQGPLPDGVWHVVINDGSVRPVVGTIAVLAGDLLIDAPNVAMVGQPDLDTFAAALGSSVGQPNYRADCDFNCDGVIDAADQAIIDANFGTIWVFGPTD